MAHSFTPSDWSRIEAILDDVLERDPGERAEAIARACGDDLALRAHVEALVAADSNAPRFLERLPRSMPPGSSARRRDGTRCRWP